MPLFGPPNIEKLKASGNIRGLVHALGDKDPEIREKAELALGEIGASTLQELEAAIIHDNESVRAEAVQVLGRISGARSLAMLIDKLKDASQVVSGTAKKALISTGLPAVARLIALYRMQPGLLSDINDILIGIGTPAVEPLIAALDSDHKETRDNAAFVLGCIGDVRAVEPLINKLENYSSLFSNQVSNPLLKFGALAIPSLTKELVNSQSSIQREVVEILDGIGWEPDKDETGAFYWIAKKEWEKCVEIGAPSVKALLTRTRSEKDWKGVVDTLIKIGKISIDPILQVLTGVADDKHLNILAGIDALVSIQDKKAIAPLLIIARDRQRPDYIAHFAIQAVGKIKDKQAVEPLVAILCDWHWQTTADALDALGWKPQKDEQAAWYWIAKGKIHRCIPIGEPAIKPLLAVLKDRSIGDRDLALKALDKMGWEPPRDENGAIYWIAKYRFDQCLDIGAAAIPPLLKALQENDAEACVGAARCLAQIYRLQGLLEQDRAEILKYRDRITAPEVHVHTDYETTGCHGGHTDVNKDMVFQVDFPL